MQAMQLHDACNDYIWIVIVVAQRPFFGHLFLGIDSIIAHSLTQLLKDMSKRSWADVLPLPCLKRRKVKNPSDEHDDNWAYGHDGTWGYHDEHDGKWGYHHWHSSYHSWTWGHSSASSSWETTDEPFNQWYARVSSMTWDGTAWYGHNSPGWSYDSNAGWIFTRHDGLLWQYICGDSSYSHGNGYGYGQWHLIDPGLPPDGSDAPDGDADPDDADPDGELAPSDDNESA